jgi:hypothetical protein
MGDFLKRAALDRMGGDKASAPRAALVATVAGAASAVLTYRVLRG